jgi:hypothetical protein
MERMDPILEAINMPVCRRAYGDGIHNILHAKQHLFRLSDDNSLLDR